jgi:hypothetical protein
MEARTSPACIKLGIMGGTLVVQKTQALLEAFLGV